MAVASATDALRILQSRATLPEHSTRAAAGVLGVALGLQYPPGVVSGRVSGGTVGIAAIACLAGALALELVGVAVSDPLVRAGQGLALVGAVLHLWLLGCTSGSVNMFGTTPG